MSFPSLVWQALSGGSWQVLGNVMLYLPWACCCPLCGTGVSWWRVTGLGLALSLVTELVQPVVGRSFDVDDLIANTLGTLVGYGLFAVVRIIMPRAVKWCRGVEEDRPAE